MKTPVAFAVPVCAFCGVARDVSRDNEFLLLNPENHYEVKASQEGREYLLPPRYTSKAPTIYLCSTSCCEGLLRDPAHRDRIAVMEPQKLPPTPEKVATCEACIDALVAEFGDEAWQQDCSEELRYLDSCSRDWERTRAGQIGCECASQHDDLVELIADTLMLARHTCQVDEHASFIYLLRPDQSSEELRFSGVECALRWCQAHPYDAKGYWDTHGLRCTECDCVQRTDLGAHEALWLDVKVAGRKTGLPFCSPGCLLKRVAEHPEMVFVYARHRRLFPRADRQYWRGNGCASCFREGQKVPEKTRYIVLSGSPWHSSFDDERPTAFCSRVCLMERFRKEVVLFETKRLGPWYVSPEEPDDEFVVEE